MVGVIDQVVAPNRVNNVKLIFLSLQTVDLAIAGASSRVAKGGQNAPEYIVRRRFDAGLSNFQEICRIERFSVQDNCFD